MQKPAPVDHPIQDVLRARWSGRAFTPQPIDAGTLQSLFEAARWAPSSGNEQPWRFVVATRDAAEDFERLLGCLTPGNQRWAKNAGALVLACAQLQWQRNGDPNRHAWHDCGLALGFLLVEASARGVLAHPMAGYDAERARAEAEIPAEFEPVTFVALGYSAEPDTLPDDLREREVAPRRRRPLHETVFGGRWSRPASFLPS